MSKLNLLIFSIVITLGFISCNKYEEGPKMSLLTKKDRFARSWVLESSETNGEVTLTTDEETIFYVFKKNSTYSKTFKVNGVDSVQIGNWNLSKGGENLQLIMLDSLDITEESKIVLLTNKQFKIRDLTEANPTTYLFAVK